MKKLLLLFILYPYFSFSQTYIGARTDISSYNFKYPYGKQWNAGPSYAMIIEHAYKPLVSIGSELGYHDLEFQRNKSYNMFLKPYISLNVQTKRSNIALDIGLYIEQSLKREINNIETEQWWYISPENNDTISVSYSKTFFYKTFVAPSFGLSYCYRINKIDIGVKWETAGSIGGFYKGYESNFNRFGLFIKYRISNKQTPVKF